MGGCMGGVEGPSTQDGDGPTDPAGAWRGSGQQQTSRIGVQACKCVQVQARRAALVRPRRRFGRRNCGETDPRAQVGAPRRSRPERIRKGTSINHQRPRPSFLVPRPFRSESPSGFENLNPFSLKCSPSGSEVVGSSACHARQDIRG